MTSKETEKGDVAELKFAYEAKRKGYNIAFPAGSDCPYDFIIESGGETIRVQVKSVMSKEKERDCYKINATHGSRRNKVYTKEHCDMLAIYVRDVDSFYLIPIEKLVSQTIRVYPHRPEKKEGYEVYYENWKGIVK